MIQQFCALYFFNLNTLNTLNILVKKNLNTLNDKIDRIKLDVRYNEWHIIIEQYMKFIRKIEGFEIPGVRESCPLDG